MTEQKNTSVVIAAQTAVALTGQRSSLVVRGLVAVQRSEGSQLICNSQDERYRQARIILDRRIGMIRMIGKSDMSDAKNNSALLSAFKTFQQLADENYGKAYYPLSLFYDSFSSSAFSMACMAFDWCFDNQTNQDVELWCDLAEMYGHGSGIERDDEQAAYWFRKAAEQGDVRGQINLGYMYKNGLGVEENYEQAVYWYSKAAKQGNTEAQETLKKLGVDWKNDAS